MTTTEPLDPIECRALEVLYTARTGEKPNLRVNTILLRDPWRPRVSADAYSAALASLLDRGLVMRAPLDTGETITTWQITRAGVDAAREMIEARTEADNDTRRPRCAHPGCSTLAVSQGFCTVHEPRVDGAPDLPVGYVAVAEGIGYVVKSRTSDGVWWLVAGRSCSCPAGRDGRDTCWHRTLVAEFCKRLGEEQARPAAPAAPASMFVD